MAGERAEADRQRVREHRSLSDFVWKNCSHDVAPVSPGAACRECALDYSRQARAEGRRDGLEEAAKLVDGMAAVQHGGAVLAKLRVVRDAIRALIGEG